MSKNNIGFWHPSAVFALLMALFAAGQAYAQETADLDPSILLLGKGVQAESLGQVLEAEKNFREALALKEGTVPDTDPALVGLQLRLATNLSSQGRFKESELIFESVRVALATAGNVSLNAKYLLNSAIDLRNRGDLDEAAKRARTANEILLKALQDQRQQSSFVQGVGVNKPELAFGLAVEAKIALARNEIAIARQYESLARKIVVSVKGSPSWWLAALNDILAEIELAEQNFDAAETRMRSSLILKRNQLGETRTTAESYLNLGRLLHAREKTDEAVTAMQSGINIVEAGLKDGQSLRPEKVQRYLTAVWELAQQQPERRDELYAEMFSASQLVRQGTTAQTVGRMVARLSAGSQEIGAQVRRSQEANRQRDVARIDLGTEAAKRAQDRDEARIELARQRYLELKEIASVEAAKLREVFPQYEQIIEGQTVDVEEIRNLLRPGEAFATFLNGPNNGFTFVVTVDQLYITPSALGIGDVAAAVTELKEAFDVTDGTLGVYNIQASYDLYAGLFGELDPVLRSLEHLIVAPTGPLLSLPFGILAMQDAPSSEGNQQYMDTDWLGRNMATSISPSLSAFVGLRGLVRPSTAPRAMIGFGDPVFVGEHAGMDGLENECPADGVLPAEMVRGLAPLPDTRDELEIVADLVGRDQSTVTYGDAVSEPALRDAPLKDYRVVYFATHGLLPEELECQTEPALALTAPQISTSTSNDGLLGASEIAELELDADLVVLSACNTGGSDGEFGGDSLSGLARAFFYSGARSLVVSHWQVSSEDTVSLMTGLFGQSAAGLSEAMRLAQVEMMNNPETAHPFFWGPFTLVGDGARALVF